MRKALVTGGAGFIGSHLTEGLLKAGNQVVVLDDLSTGRESNLAAVRSQVNLIQDSITDPKAVAEAVKGVDVIFHLAALPSVQRSVEAPVLSHEACATGTLNVLEAARHAGVRRVVYAASSSAYGDTPGALRVETDAIAPLSPYAAAKLAGEHYCKAFTASYGLETVRLRFFNIFGPRQDPSSPYSGVLAKFSLQMLRGEQPTIFGDGETSRDFTYIDNAVSANLLACAAPAAECAGRVFNCATGRRVTLNETFEALKELTGYTGKAKYGPERAGDVKHSLADISLAQKHLGYKTLVSFEEGLRRTVEWYKTEAVTAGAVRS